MTWSSLHIFSALVIGPWIVEVQVQIPSPGQDCHDIILFSGLVHPCILEEGTVGTDEAWCSLAPKTPDGRLQGWELQASIKSSPAPSNAAQSAIQTVQVRLDRQLSAPRGLEGNPTLSITGDHLHHHYHRVALEPFPIRVHSFKVSLASSSSSDLAINLQGKETLANGFQSWSKSQAGHDARSVFEKPNWLYNQMTQLGLASDMDIYEYSGQQGLVHSNGWTVIRDKVDLGQDRAQDKAPKSPRRQRPEELVFCGSLSENVGYTIFIMDYVANGMTISQDIKGRVLCDHGDTLVLKSFFAWNNNDALVWDEYAAAWKAILGDRRVIKDTLHEQVSGWTSWYLHYEAVSEAIVLENIDYYTSGTNDKWPAKIIQIDDGYTVVGDWLQVDTAKFPHGMKYVADRIREHDLMPGLWMAPFCASKRSKIVQEHPDWFIHWPKARSGQFWKPFSCCDAPRGHPHSTDSSKMMLAHPAFQAGAVALDLENHQVRQHLANVFHVVTQEWGFRILKLDFLFAAAQVPRNGKTRGQLMWEAMQMVRDWAGAETILLGCGVPLGSAMMLVDYCRVGCDVGAGWDSPQRFFHDREYISTFNSLTGTLARWGLSGRFFGNDPDVYFTRTWSMGLTRQERLTLMSLNHLLGHLVLTSDPMGVHRMDGDQKWMLTLFHPWPSMPGFSKMPAPEIVRIIQPLVNQKDVYLVHVQWHGRVLVVAVNLTCKRQQVCLNVVDQMIARDHKEEEQATPTKTGHAASIYFHSVLGLFGAASSAYTLQKRETVVFVRIKDSQGRLCALLHPQYQPSNSVDGSESLVLTTRCGHFLPTAEIASVQGDKIHLHPLPAGLTRSTQIWLARPVQKRNSSQDDRKSDRNHSRGEDLSTAAAAPWTVNGKLVQLEPSCSPWAGPSLEIGSVWI